MRFVSNDDMNSEKNKSVVIFGMIEITYILAPASAAPTFPFTLVSIREFKSIRDGGCARGKLIVGCTGFWTAARAV